MRYSWALVYLLLVSHLFLAGHCVLRTPVCGAAAALRGRWRSRLPCLAVALPQVGIPRRQVGSLLCAVLRQAVSVGYLWARGYQPAVLLSLQVRTARQQLNAPTSPPHSGSYIVKQPLVARYAPFGLFCARAAAANVSKDLPSSTVCSYIVKQLSRSERQSFLEFAPDYFRCAHSLAHR